MVAIKICGMRDPANIAAVAQYHPDYMGFICWLGSRRFVGQELERAVLDKNLGSIKRVGVFVNPSLEEVVFWCKRLGLAIVQLHGDETLDFCSKIKKIDGIDEVWKAIPVAASYPNLEVAQYQEVVDRILFDTKSDERGGSGKSFSWDLLGAYSGTKPMVLSGGLGYENIGQVIELTKQHIQLSVLDFNSTLESVPGVKDVNLVAKVLGQIQRD
jgi:phosphoribosylanthranilate isomerase